MQTGYNNDSIARRELALLEFEMFYAIMIPEKSKRESAEFVKKLRAEDWKKALIKASGNEEKALQLYMGVEQ